MNIPILYEDEDCLAINKPAGLVVHADGKSDQRTLTDWILEKYPETKDVGESITLSNGKVLSRPGIVHRLDRETSGTMIIAKNQKAHQALKAQFQDRTISKIYNAFVWGEMKDDDGIINRPIGRSKKDFRLWSAQRGARGEMREAETWYTVKKRGHGFSFVEVEPKTGRTHQIRVHFKAINYPIVADSLYASGRPPALGFTRLALHSARLCFIDLKGKRHIVEAPLPEDFKRALAQIEAENDK